MRLRQEDHGFSQFNDGEYLEEREDETSLAHKRQVKRKLEERLESRRLRHELDDFEEDEDYWDPDM